MREHRPPTFFAWLLEQIRAAITRAWHWRTDRLRAPEPEFQSGEVGALLTQLALSRIGGARLTIDECLATVRTDRRTCTESFVIQHLRGTARAVPPLRAVVPLEALEGLPADAPSPVQVRRRPNARARAS